MTNKLTLHKVGAFGVSKHLTQSQKMPSAGQVLAVAF